MSVELSVHTRILCDAVRILRCSPSKNTKILSLEQGLRSNSCSSGHSVFRRRYRSAPALWQIACRPLPCCFLLTSTSVASHFFSVLPSPVVCLYTWLGFCPREFTFFTQWLLCCIFQYYGAAFSNRSQLAYYWLELVICASPFVRESESFFSWHDLATKVFSRLLEILIIELFKLLLTAPA